MTAGDVLTYTVTVRNTGDVALGNLQISDDLPGAGPLDCGGFSGTLAPGAVVGCTVGYTVTGTDVSHGSVSNTATATNGEVRDASDPVVVPTGMPPSRRWSSRRSSRCRGRRPDSSRPSSGVGSLPLTGA